MLWGAGVDLPRPRRPHTRRRAPLRHAYAKRRRRLTVGLSLGRRLFLLGLPFPHDFIFLVCSLPGPAGRGRRGLCCLLLSSFWALRSFIICIVLQVGGAAVFGWCRCPAGARTAGTRARATTSERHSQTDAKRDPRQKKTDDTTRTTRTGTDVAARPAMKVSKCPRCLLVSLET